MVNSSYNNGNIGGSRLVASGFFPSLDVTSAEKRAYKDLCTQCQHQVQDCLENSQGLWHWGPVGSLTLQDQYQLQKAQYIEQRGKHEGQASVLIKGSVQVPGTNIDQVLDLLSSSTTEEYRNNMHALYRDVLLDAVCLYTLDENTGIKWAAVKQKSAANESIDGVDFCYLEQRGMKLRGGVPSGYVIQESIERKEVPTLESIYRLRRKRVHRTGVWCEMVPNRQNVVSVTSVFQVDVRSDSASLWKLPVEEGFMIKRLVSLLNGLAPLLERHRISQMRFMEKWQWVPDTDRKACAVCSKSFTLRKKHHCRQCGEVCCSKCAPLREVDLGSIGIDKIRICTGCVLQARQIQKNLSSGSSILQRKAPSASSGVTTASVLYSPSTSSNSSNHGPRSSYDRRGSAFSSASGASASTTRDYEALADNLMLPASRGSSKGQYEQFSASLRAVGGPQSFSRQSTRRGSASTISSIGDEVDMQELNSRLTLVKEKLNSNEDLLAALNTGEKDSAQVQYDSRVQSLEALMKSTQDAADACAKAREIAAASSNTVERHTENAGETPPLFLEDGRASRISLTDTTLDPKISAETTRDDVIVSEEAVTTSSVPSDDANEPDEKSADEEDFATEGNSVSESPVNVIVETPQSPKKTRNSVVNDAAPKVEVEAIFNKVCDLRKRAEAGGNDAEVSKTQKLLVEQVGTVEQQVQYWEQRSMKFNGKSLSSPRGSSENSPKNHYTNELSMVKLHKASYRAIVNELHEIMGLPGISRTSVGTLPPSNTDGSYKKQSEEEGSKVGRQRHSSTTLESVPETVSKDQYYDDKESSGLVVVSPAKASANNGTRSSRSMSTSSDASAASHVSTEEDVERYRQAAELFLYRDSMTFNQSPADTSELADNQKAEQPEVHEEPLRNRKSADSNESDAFRLNAKHVIQQMHVKAADSSVFQRASMALANIFTSLLQHGMDSKYVTIKRSEHLYSQSLSDASGADDVLKLVGYISLPKRLVIQDQLELDHVEVALDLLELELLQLKVGVSPLKPTAK